MYAEKNSKEELIKLVQENPDLPVVFFAQNDEFCYDYGATVFKNFYCYTATIYVDYKYDDCTYYDDVDDIIEEYRDRLCDDEEYKDLEDEEFEKAVAKYVDENIEHYEAIVIDMRA